jgi:membrane protease YdiL (CAAX protease family)
MWIAAGIVNTFIAGILIKRRFPTWNITRALITLLTFSLIFTYFDIFPLEQVLVVTWIPAAEEIVFRLGVSLFLQKKLGNIYGGIYATALLFAVLHVGARLTFNAEEAARIFLGPFVLSALSDGVYRVGGRIGPCIALHAVCNFASGYFSRG